MDKFTKKEINCKEVLWETLETMSKDYSMSVDYLIEVALKEFTHSKGYLELPKNKDKNKVRKLNDSLLEKHIEPKDEKLEFPSFDEEKPNLQESKSKRRSKPKPMPTPPKPPVKPSPAPTPKSSPKLFVEYNKKVTEVQKNKFVIGRGSQADLRITENPSISRKHALIVQKNGKFYIKDLGSINGTEYKGKKIDLRPISDGDVFTICDIPIKFKLS